MKYENQLLPVLREGVDVIKMILFKSLRDLLSGRYPEGEPQYIKNLSGAIINELFGTPNPTPLFMEFARENRARIDEAMSTLASDLGSLRIPITDALRVQFLCDHQEGIDNAAMLRRARELNILMVEREVPLPAKFMSLVRKLGAAYDIITRPG